MKKSKADLVQGWLEKARRDLQAALRELNNPDPLTDIICFHAQQAAEKYLNKTHILEQLILLAGRKDPDFLDLKDKVSLLTPYAVETRYPEFEEPLLDDAKEAVRVAEKVREFVLRKLPKSFG